MENGMWHSKQGWKSDLGQRKTHRQNWGRVGRELRDGLGILARSWQGGSEVDLFSDI